MYSVCFLVEAFKSLEKRRVGRIGKIHGFRDKSGIAF
jgi:hypothetical protein